MRRALQVARAAGVRGEVPVGAVAVRDGAVIAAAGNAIERRRDATAHAEMLVLRRVAGIVGGWRLDGVTLYATLEPCPMCAGAMVLARIPRCVYGASDPKKGADGSAFDVLRNARNNHRIEVTSGVIAEECGALLQGFFQERRAAKLDPT
jgi:tRNA(adenine34) deaminase